MDKGCTNNPHTAHHGHAVKRLRQDQRLSQEAFGKLVGMSQETLSRYEEKEKIDDEILARMAKVLGVPVEFIKEMEDEKPLTFYIENNTVTNTNENNTTNGATQVENTTGQGGSPTLNNYVDKEFYTTLLDRMQSLYEKSMQLYQENNKFLHQQIASLEKEIEQLKKQ